MKRGSRLRWVGAVMFVVVVAVATAAAGAAGSKQDPTKPSVPAFSTPVAGQMNAAGTISPRSVPRVHRNHDDFAEVDEPSVALLAHRAGINKQAPAGPLTGNATTNLGAQKAGTGASSGTAKPKSEPGAAGRARSRAGNASAFGSNLEDLNSFTGATLNNTGCCEPPDTQIAVSSTRVVEPVNLTAFVFDHGGNDLGSFDLVSFMSFGQPNNFGSDPKIVYDAGTDRWYMTLMVCQAGACGGSWTTMGVDLAVSQSNDPFGSWLIYQNIYSGTPFNDQGNLQDQPKLGFSGDKVTISDNVYTGHCGSGSCFAHEDVITWNKSELFTGSAHYVGFTSGYAFDSIPASPSPSSATSTNTQWLVWQGFGSLGVNQITGLPNVSSVSNSTQNPSIGNMTGTVTASGIPAGAQSSNFIESVTLNGGHLWAASTDGCTRGTGTVDCTRIDGINISNPGSVSMFQDQDVGDANAFEVYPSVAQDCIGDLYFGVTFSSTTSLPAASMIATTSPPASSYARFNYATGDTTYSGGRWGDYSGIQEDPGDCGNVWTGQEFGAVGSSGNWATAMGQFSFDTPFISSTSPASGPATGGTVVDIFGFDFVNGGTSVNFGSTPAAAVFFVDAHHLEAISPQGSGGPVNITATTANGTSTAGSAFSWVPAVTGVSPSAGPTAGGNSVTISGAGFNGATGVSFGGVAASFTVNSDGNITATAPAHAAGSVDVTVTGPTGTSAATASDVYTYDAPPTITSLSPKAGSTAGGNTVTINGTNFTSGATVKFSTSTATSVTFVSATQLKAKAPARAAGTVNVRVTTPGGTSATSNNSLYAYGAPTISSLSPKAGPVAGGNIVTINGNGFVPGVTVAFGATPASPVTFVTYNQIKVTAPFHGASTVNVRVTNPAGTSTTSNNTLYAFGAPTISSLSPNAGPAAGGNIVTINGNGFVPGVTVAFGSTAATSVTFVSYNQIKAKAPAHAAVPVNVRVTNPVGASATGNQTLYAYGAPAVTSLSPHSGTHLGGTTVTINGLRFVPGMTVKFGTTAATSVTFVATNQIKAKAPAHAVGTVDVRVTSAAGTSPVTAADRYGYT